MKITVFGGSKPKPGEVAYDQALYLGQALAKAGHSVMTGGYIGTMEAVSRGAAEAGGHVVGLTCEEIENWRKVRPNPWVLEVCHYKTLRERLMGLIETCDAAMALPGGVGTLAEVCMMWDHLLTDAITPRPLILIGAGWRTVIDKFLQEFDDYVAPAHRDWIQYVWDVDEAVTLVGRYQTNDLPNGSPYGKTNH